MKTLNSQIKLAAPRSQRGFWSRLFSPSGGDRGAQKDTELEMDNILEGISTLAQSSQQIRNSISAIQYQAASLGGYPAITSAVGNLSPNDWNRTLQAVQSLQSAVNSAPPDTNLFQLRDLAYGVSNNMGNVYNQIERMQRNMFNLRQRDPVKGRTYGPSASEEFGQLEMALERLIRNPLDERALFYSQKLHGRLEDALNMRSSKIEPDFQEWVDTHQGPSQFEPEETQVETEQPQANQNDLPLGQQLAERLGPQFTNALIRIFEEIAQEGMGTESEAQNVLNLVDELRMPVSSSDAGMGNMESVDNSVMPGTLEPERNEVNEDLDNNPDPEEVDYSGETMLDVNDWAHVRDPRLASQIDTLIKIADIADEISPEVADLLDKYIAKHTKEDESSFEFPENALILKD